MSDADETARPYDDDAARESRLRRAAQRQGLTLAKSRRRDPRALDYGTYQLLEVTGPGWRGRLLVAGGEYGMDLDDVEEWLNGATQRRWSTEAARAEG